MEKLVENKNIKTYTELITPDKLVMECYKVFEEEPFAGKET